VSRRTNRPIVIAAAIVALILACGPRAQRSATAGTHNANTVTAPSLDTAIAASTRVTVGSGVDFAMHVTNLHDHALELRFPSGQTHEFVVIDSAGREVWRWSEGRLFTQSLQTRLLASRETLSFIDRWDGGGRSGRFTAISTLRSANHPVEERVDFVLP
jgi:hypothetical protein